MPSTSPLPAAPGPDDFRALARSSPWRFGTLHFTHREERAHGEGPVEAWLTLPGHLEVLARGERHDIEYGDPMWGNYRWVAMLDPVELSRGVEVSEVHARERFGRLTWTATCRALPETAEDAGDGYDPRCSCCPLLFGAVSQALEAVGGGYAAPDDEVAGYPSAYWVSLDVETGVVVDVEPQDGDRANTAFANEIHEVGPLPAH